MKSVRRDCWDHGRFFASANTEFFSGREKLKDGLKRGLFKVFRQLEGVIQT